MAGNPTPRRRPFLRMLSYLLAILILGAHIVTFGISKHHPAWLSLDMRDLLAHTAMFMTFAFVYRYSFTRAVSPPGAGFSTVLVCSSWGALCEFVQIWLPRDFNPLELAANMLAPVLVVALFYIFQREQPAAD